MKIFLLISIAVFSSSAFAQQAQYGISCRSTGIQGNKSTGIALTRNSFSGLMDFYETRRVKLKNYRGEYVITKWDSLDNPWQGETWSHAKTGGKFLWNNENYRSEKYKDFLAFDLKYFVIKTRKPEAGSYRMLFPKQPEIYMVRQRPDSKGFYKIPTMMMFKSIKKGFTKTTKMICKIKPRRY